MGESLMRPAGPGVDSALVSPKEELSCVWATAAGNTRLTSHEAAARHETGVLSRRLVAGPNIAVASLMKRTSTSRRTKATRRIGGSSSNASRRIALISALE